jgi:hypothetical protein
VSRIDCIVATARVAAPWVYLAIAVAGSLMCGFGAFKIHGEFPQKAKGWPRWHQYWFNGAGAAVGWLAGWVVLVRWLSCSRFVCHDEPTGWTILLVILAFVGVSGYLPLLAMQTIVVLRALLAKIFPPS